jgi:MOSC domain-containing protein YiiM
LEVRGTSEAEMMIRNRKTVTQARDESAWGNQAGVVVSLQVCPGHRQPMRKLDSVRVIENRGLEGDRHARPDSSRQVLLIEEETLRRYQIPVGALKENITTRGIELRSLKKRTRLQMGEVVLEITKPCTPCSRVDEIRMGLQEELQGQRGMLARVIRGGEIKVDDTIQVIDTA